MKQWLALLCGFCLLLTGCSEREVQQSAASSSPPPVSQTEQAESTEPPIDVTTEQPEGAEDVSSVPKVYMTTDISPEGLISVYEALDREATGNVAVKISTGEEGSYYLRPELIGSFVQSLNGTIVESNTAYSSRRASTALHLQLAQDRGYTDIAPVAILDADGSLSLPIAQGEHLTENLVGAGFVDYDFYVILSHFKGHHMGGFGGAIKNMSVGIASAAGKCLIHSAGVSSTDRMLSVTPQEDFQESMAESAKSVADALGENILYINVMNNISVDCDCQSYPDAPLIEDIGILASTDPIALDQACVDLVYQAENSDALIERIESRLAHRALEYGEELGLGSRTYELISVSAESVGTP